MLHFKKKTSTCGSQVGHIQIFLCVIGSNWSTGATHFQPCIALHVIIVCLTKLILIASINCKLVTYTNFCIGDGKQFHTWLVKLLQQIGT